MKKVFLMSGLMLLSGYAAAADVGKVISSTPVMREKQTVGYKVVYEYAGKRYTTQLPQDPGATVNLQITPSAASKPAARVAAAPVTTASRIAAAPVATASTAAAREPIYTEPLYEDRWDADRDRPYRVARSTDGWDADRDRGYSTPIYTAPRYVERVYAEPSYYAPRTYYSRANYGYSYGDNYGHNYGHNYGANYGYNYGGNYGHNYGYSNAPLWPLVGLSIGLASSYRGNGYYGGHHGHRGHHYYGGHRRW